MWARRNTNNTNNDQVTEIKQQAIFIIQLLLLPLVFLIMFQVFPSFSPGLVSGRRLTNVVKMPKLASEAYFLKMSLRGTLAVAIHLGEARLELQE